MIPPAEPSPEELANNRASDCPTAGGIEILHAEMSHKLERIAWSILRDWPLAADAVQETFALLTTRYQTVPADQQRGWLVKTVQFQAHNLKRKQQRAQNLSAQLLSSGRLGTELAQFGSQPDATIERLEEQQLLRRAVAALPEAQRIVVLKRMREEKGFAEIAEELGVPLGTVLSRMRLALEKLRSQFKS